MSNENYTMDTELKDMVITHLTRRFSKELPLLYPCQDAKKLVEMLSDDTLASLACDEMHLIDITRELPEPEARSVYWNISRNHPNISQLYPSVNIFALSEGQIERLSRTNPDHIQDVLGKPEVKVYVDILSSQPSDPMVPPKRPSRTYYSSDGSPKTISPPSNGSGVEATRSNSRYNGPGSRD
jgi:hypothetical protein